MTQRPPKTSVSPSLETIASIMLRRFSSDRSASASAGAYSIEILDYKEHQEFREMVTKLYTNEIQMLQ
jgi:hypothetical protein